MDGTDVLLLVHPRQEYGTEEKPLAVFAPGAQVPDGGQALPAAREAAHQTGLEISISDAHCTWFFLNALPHPLGARLHRRYRPRPALVCQLSPCYRTSAAFLSTLVRHQDHPSRQLPLVRVPLRSWHRASISAPSATAPRELVPRGAAAFLGQWLKHRDQPLLHIPDLDEWVARGVSLLQRYGVPDGVIEHSLLVAAVAVVFGHALMEKGVGIDLIQLGLAALTHDIGKGCRRPPGLTARDHGEASAAILAREGLDNLSQPAWRHFLPSVLDPRRAPVTWLDKVVYYADKVVLRRVVTVAERLEDIRRRYPHQASNLEACLPHIQRLEREILTASGLDDQSWPAMAWIVRLMM